MRRTEEDILAILFSTLMTGVYLYYVAMFSLREHSAVLQCFYLRGCWEESPPDLPLRTFWIILFIQDNGTRSKTVLVFLWHLISSQNRKVFGRFVHLATLVSGHGLVALLIISE